MIRQVKATVDIREIWQKYKATGKRALRNVLMEYYLPAVRYSAERMRAKLPDEIDRDDLFSAGVFGLMDAIEAFDLDRGVKFETYCAARVRGAMLDELRSMDWVPRLVRMRSHVLDRASRELEAMLGRSPSENELAQRLKLGRSDFDKLKRDGTAVTQISLSRKYGETDSDRDICEIDVIEDKRCHSPISEIHKKDIKELITRGLSRAERLVLILYYYEELTMKEIGHALDLSESRVSQMHSVILDRLKEQFELRRKELIH